MGMIDNLRCTIEPSNGASDWFTSPLTQSWVLMFIFVGVLFSIVLLMRRRRDTAVAFGGTVQSGWRTAIPPYRRSIPHLALELARARRYRHPFSVLVLGLDDDQLMHKNQSLVAGSGNSNFNTHFFFALLASVLRDNLRDSDLVTYDLNKDLYIILLTETSAQEAEKTVSRLDELIFKRTAAHLRAGTAEFPNDGLIIEDLVSHAQANCKLRALRETPPKNDAARKSQGAQRKESHGALKALTQN
jgi:GGDEF domain-containing protein